MSQLEANKIIAKYMGRNISRCGEYVVEPDDFFADLYTESLDSLIPAWEKLDKTNINFSKYKTGYQCHIGSCIMVGEWYTGKTIQESAAIATAKAILELK